jgi:hypothetical protein
MRLSAIDAVEIAKMLIERGASVGDALRTARASLERVLGFSHYQDDLVVLRLHELIALLAEAERNEESTHDKQIED